MEIEEDVLSPEERDRIKKALEDMCKMKSEEFLLLGIQTTPEQIWSCVSHQYKKEYPELHQIVNDILSLKTSKFMNWLIIQNQRGLL
ncbi:hypothetical protein BHU72_08675 [Desulfuribacillus stibiiarsenatis]|uniref:Post-transcriptional regulator n=1 Tax=Desulfuribacillus stibiiarsenatis TaxID=1390249 RepID=A0A1E5L3F1_9FIRM|nr:hypothetical protein BHU72_08675 [Desulfuribacillus stibiiarsenatis]